MDIPLGQSMPREIMEKIRIELKDREKAHKFFDLAREAVKQNMDEIMKSRFILPKDERILQFVMLIMRNETLRRIDDFEMAHLNMIDIREECCGKDRQVDSNRNSNLSALAKEFVKPMFDTIRMAFQLYQI